jgi:hypothetical protein
MLPPYTKIYTDVTDDGKQNYRRKKDKSGIPSGSSQLQFDPEKGCDSRVSKLRSETLEIPRLGFALCLPVQISYVV